MTVQAADRAMKKRQRWNNQQGTGPLLWFLLAWESLVYIWTLLPMYGMNPISLDKGQKMQPLFSLKDASPSTLAVVLFTTLMIAQCVLLWLGLANRVPRHLTWLYFCLQGTLVFIISFIVHQNNVVLNLYLALILGAIALLHHALYTIIVTISYVVLFLINSLMLSPFIFDYQVNSLNTLWGKTDYAAMVLLIVGFIVFYVQQMHMHNRLALAHMQLQAQALRIEELTLLTERQRMARELHDTLAQGVAGLIMQLEAANAQLNQRHFQLVEDILHQTMSNARGTLAEARSAIDDLRTISSSEDFTEAMNEEIRRFSTATGIPCEVTLPTLHMVPAILYEQIFRMVREGLQNVARHAHACNVLVRLALEEETVVIEVQDDGVGFEVISQKKQSGHYGLIGLRERVQLAGGMLELKSSPGAGTTLRLRLPRNIEGGLPWTLPSMS